MIKQEVFAEKADGTVLNQQEATSCGKGYHSKAASKEMNQQVSVR